MDAAESNPEGVLRPGVGRACFAMVFALGVFLRVFHFGDPSLSTDEYGTWWTVAGDGYGAVFDRAVAIQGQSPLYYLLVRITVDACGVAPWSLRLPSLVFGIALLWVGMRLALALFDDVRIALAVGLTFAVDSYLIYYSQTARPYSLALLCAAACVWSYVAVHRGGGRLASVSLCMTAALTWYSHWLFGIILLVLLLHLLTTRPWATGTVRRWLILAGITAGLMAPGFWQFVNLFGRREALDWVNSSSSFFASNLLFRGFHAWPMALALLTAVGLSVVRRRASRPSLDPSTRRLVLIWVVAPILVFGALPPCSVYR